MVAWRDHDESTKHWWRKHGKSLPAPPRWKNCAPRKRCCSRPWRRQPWSKRRPSLGVGRATVPRLQQRLRQSVRSRATRPRWGGRRKALLSAEQEAEFLAPWAEQAKEAGLLVLSPIRAALAQRLGRPVAASVVWRLLARHGWRKVAPDTRHPKSDPAAQEAWKKNSPKRWLPC